MSTNGGKVSLHTALDPWLKLVGAETLIFSFVAIEIDANLH